MIGNHIDIRFGFAQFLEYPVELDSQSIADVTFG